MGGICSMETLEKILPCIKSSEAQNANLAKDGEDVVRYVRADQLWEADENQLAGDKPAAMPEENATAFPPSSPPITSSRASQPGTASLRE